MTDINNVVVGLQGNPVSSTAPTTDQLLQWNGSEWAPISLAKCSAYSTSTQSGTNSGVQITGWTTLFDSTGSFNTSTSEYVIPKDGYYSIGLQFQVNSAIPGEQIGGSIIINGSHIHNGPNLAIPNDAGTFNWTVSTNALIYATTGQVMTFQFQDAYGATWTLSGVGNFNWVNIAQLA